MLEIKLLKDMLARCEAIDDPTTVEWRLWFCREECEECEFYQQPKTIDTVKVVFDNRVIGIVLPLNWGEKEVGNVLCEKYD